MHTISACRTYLEAWVTQYKQKDSGTAAQWKEHKLLLVQKQDVSFVQVVTPYLELC